MHPAARALALTTVLLPLAAGAADVPVPGKVFRLAVKGGDAASRSLVVRTAASPALAPPFGDPTSGASLFVFSSNLPGGCRLETPLPGANWSPIGGDPAKGWRYRDETGAAAGVAKIVVKASAKGGRIIVKARGAAMPCAVQAAQPLPVEVSLRLGNQRYCTAFGGTVRRNEAGKLKATGSPAPLACAGGDVRIATLNVLHGLTCPAETVHCRLPERIALLGQWIVAHHCPDVVALQEVWSNRPGEDVLTQVEEQLLDVCPLPYHMAFQQTFVADDSVILSRHPVVFNASLDLHGPARYVQHARIDHPVGLLDVFSTHLASGSDAGGAACTFFGPCPTECVTAGAVTVRDCQAVQVAALATAEHDVEGPAFVVGDFNAHPGSFVYQQMVTALGATDTQLAAGNPECDPGTGIGCTAGREDADLTDLEAPALGVDERIDYAFLIPPTGASTCTAVLDGPGDADGDGVGTRLFAAAPDPFAPSCGPSPLPLCWVSDHSGVEVDLACE